MHILRHTIIATLLVFGVAQTAAKVTLGFKGEQAATVGIYIKDILTDQVIAENNQQMAMSPASVMKTITAASVYSTIDHSFNFETKVFLTGNVSDGICYGNLLIDASADPTIDSSNFPESPTLCSRIVDALKSAGINELKGTVIVDEHLQEPGCVPQWEVDDVPWGYGAGLFGFNYRDNVFTLWPATKKSKPHVPGLKINVIKSKGVNLKRGINSDRLTVYGPSVGNHNWKVNTTMYDPASTFAYELCDSLKAADIKLSTAVKDSDERILLYVHRSPSLAEILTQTLVHSHNLFAEGMLRILAPDGTREDAINRELSIWEGRGLSTSFDAVIDGSGLARANKLQPQLIGDVLEWMAESEYCDDYVSFFPKVGYDGTVKSFLKDTPLQGKLALKTGSMNAVQCYAGYKLDDAGKPTHVVVVLINSFYCDRASLRKSIEDFLLKTFQQSPQ